MVRVMIVSVARSSRRCCAGETRGCRASSRFGCSRVGFGGERLLVCRVDDAGRVCLVVPACLHGDEAIGDEGKQTRHWLWDESELATEAAGIRRAERAASEETSRRKESKRRWVLSGRADEQQDDDDNKTTTTEADGGGEGEKETLKRAEADLLILWAEDEERERGCVDVSQEE
jgi:hypothetical protein